MASLDEAHRAIKEHLTAIGFGEDAINRLLLDDLPYLTTWVLDPDSTQELAEAQAVIAFAFGFGPSKPHVPFPPSQYHPCLHHPGKTNDAIADFILPFTKRGLSIFAQWEIAESLAERDVVVPGHQVARPGTKYLGTSGVVKQFLNNGLAEFQSVMLVAHRHHMFRCREITKRVFQQEGRNISIVIPPDTPDVYDTASVQWWTRSLKDWVTYEVGNRFHNRFQGNM